MSRRLVLISEIIAPYRIPVFNALAREDDIDLHVIFLAETDKSLRQWRVYKEEIRFSYEVLPSWRKRVGGVNLLFNWGLTASLRHARPDAILCGGYNYPASWRTAWWAHHNRIPLMVWVESTTRDLRSRRAAVESLKRRFLECCDAFVVAGKSSSEYLKAYRVPEDAIFPAPNAVDTEFFTRRAQEVRADRDTFRKDLKLPSRFFLFVGRLVEEKGVFDLLRAYCALPADVRAQISLVLAGEGAARKELELAAAQVRPGNAHFKGFAQREALAAYYALADALVFPTHSDPWGLVVNEAMACGLPIIASDAAGCAADLVDDGWNGSIVPAGNVERLSAAMQQMANNASMLQEMRERSRMRVQQYSPWHCAAGIARAMRSLPVRCVA